MCKEKKQNDELNKKSLGKSVGTQPDNNDEKFFGIQAFDNPKDAWYVMTGLWSKYSLDDQDEVYILDDEDLEKAVLPIIPMNQLIEPEDIAETILFLASEQARMITGQVIKVSGGHAL